MSTMLDLTKNRYSSQWIANNSVSPSVYIDVKSFYGDMDTVRLSDSYDLIVGYLFDDKQEAEQQRQRALRELDSILKKEKDKAKKDPDVLAKLARDYEKTKESIKSARVLEKKG
jgi:predicted P-loop ATPase/GTPase